MTTFLYWNVQRKPLDGHVVRLAQQRRADVVLLVEHAKPDDTLLRLLQDVAGYIRVRAQTGLGRSFVSTPNTSPGSTAPFRATEFVFGKSSCLQCDRPERDRELAARYGKEWLGMLPAKRTEWKRGLLTLSGHARNLLSKRMLKLGDIEEAAWVDRLRLYNFTRADFALSLLP